MAAERAVDREHIHPPPYDSGAAVECRWHIDRLDAPGKRVWAVKVLPDGPYLTAQRVRAQGDLDVLADVVRDKQPRAFLQVRGRVTQKTTRMISILAP
mgnify:CR=1 FL=1